MENEKASYFEKTKITSAGLRLIHKLIVLGEPLVITKAVIGDGISEQDPVTMTELVHEIPSRQTGQDGTSAIVDLQTYLPEDEQTISTRVRVQNGDTEFTLREIALIASDPDIGDIKFAYTRDNTENAMTFPAFSGVPISATVDIAFFVHSSANVEMNVTLPAEVSLAEFNAHKNAEELDHPDGCVTTKKLAKGAVNNVRIANGAVDARAIADGTITQAKFSEDIQNKILLAPNKVKTVEVTNIAVNNPPSGQTVFTIIITTQANQFILDDFTFIELDFASVNIDNIIDNLGAGSLYTVKINNIVLYDEMGGTTLEIILPGLKNGDILINYNSLNGELCTVNKTDCDNIYGYVNHMYSKIKNAMMPSASTLEELQEE